LAKAKGDGILGVIHKEGGIGGGILDVAAVKTMVAETP
jgi:hypothetical protein